ncbi:MAG TPA: FtsW/RodA/SpoVE family cell cycle protein [Thermoflexales bacterium]|nr:FtsW/RodA/SpoVE family cell cycle protein [Thermoflexales bacterium]
MIRDTLSTTRGTRTKRGEKSRAARMLAMFEDNGRASPDRMLIIVIAVLSVFGLVMNYSTTFDWSAQNFSGPFELFARQLAFTLGGLALLVVLARIDYAYLRPFAVPAMLGILGVLGLVWVVGEARFGATRSLNDGSFQPSEAAKLFIIIYAGVWLASRGEQLKSIKLGLAPFAVIVGAVVALVAIQPDISTSVVIMLTGGAMLFVAGVPWRHIFLIGGVAGIFFVLAVRFTPHAAARWDEYVKMVTNEAELNWHLTQVRNAIVNGGLFGVGPGAGYYKFGILPVPFSDSIYPAIGEEFGLLGLTLTLGLFGAFAYLGIRIAKNADSKFGRYLAVGVTTWITAQMLLNVMGMISLLPMLGVPVPFLSKGGSSAVMALAACGVLLSVSRGTAARRALPEAAPQEEDGFARRARQNIGGQKQTRANPAFSRWNSRTRAAGVDRARRVEDLAGAIGLGPIRRNGARTRQRFAAQNRSGVSARVEQGESLLRGIARNIEGAVRGRGTRNGTRSGGTRRS